MRQPGTKLTDWEVRALTIIDEHVRGKGNWAMRKEEFMRESLKGSEHVLERQPKMGLAFMPVSPTLQRLLDDGLIEERMDDKKFWEKGYRLTEKGIRGLKGETI